MRASGRSPIAGRLPPPLSLLPLSFTCVVCVDADVVLLLCTQVGCADDERS